MTLTPCTVFSWRFGLVAPSNCSTQRWMLASTSPPARTTLSSASSVSPFACGTLWVAMRKELGFGCEGHEAGAFHVSAAVASLGATPADAAPCASPPMGG